LVRECASARCCEFVADVAAGLDHGESGPVAARPHVRERRHTVAMLAAQSDVRCDEGALRMSFTIRRLNHAVLYVRDAARAARFYQDVLGFVVADQMGDRAFFMRTHAGTDNHHDLGLFSIGAQAAPPTQGERVGLYHLAWELGSVQELAAARARLQEVGALVGESDHGTSLSLYAKDPDGNEFEVFWPVPREEWASRGTGIAPLDLEGELDRRVVAPGA
jgi:catechol 2,3-dioxygenase-like lactoylglutathione lyase family enzyme